MRQTVEASFPPYLPAADWYAIWLRHRLEGRSDEEAIPLANRELQLRPRDLGRSRISGRSGVVTLSVPIVGGRSVCNPEDLKVSDHGDWKRTHYGAVFSQLGKYPYFQAYAPEVETILMTTETGAPLRRLNSKLHEVVRTKILPDSLLDDVKTLLHTNRHRVAIIAKDYLPVGSRDTSILPTLMALGPHTIFSLLYCLLENEEID